MSVISLGRSAPAPARKLALCELPGSPARRYFFYRPENCRQRAPLVVSVHGISRNAAAHAYRLMDEAERFGLALVAPIFDKRDYGQYQQLTDRRTGARADLALLDICEAAAKRANACCDAMLMLGFSGGAQFTHRFVFAHPHMVVSAVHVAAGWYTQPTFCEAFPLGLAGGTERFEFDLVGALHVPQHVMVGERDVARDKSLRRSRMLDRSQGRTRLDRARTWADAMALAASGFPNARAPSFTVLPGVAHDFVETIESARLSSLAFNRFATDAGLKPVSLSQGDIR